MFYITHVQPLDVFDPAVHTRQDLNVFKVQIQHTEGKAPTAQLTMTLPEPATRGNSGSIRNTSVGAGAGVLTDIGMGVESGVDILTPGQRFFLVYRHQDTNHLLFAGRIQNEPRPVEGNLWSIDLMADSSTVDLKPLQDAYKRFPHWDPLFLSSSQQDRVQGMIPHYSRTEAKVQVVDPFQPSGPVQDFQNQFYQDSLQVRQKDPPYRKIHGEITVEWVQRYHGLTDISRMLVRELPEGAISTLTPDDFQKRWWKPSQVVKHTGYKIVQAHLASTTPIVAGAGAGTGDANARQSASFRINDRETTMPCHWFEPTLVVEWQYRQKRREILRFTLENPDPSAVGEHIMNWHLQDITADMTTPHWQAGMVYGEGALVQYGDQAYRCIHAHTSGTHFAAHKACWESVPQRQCALDTSWRASFFTTPRGQKAFEHAVYQARCLMLDQCRSTEITFAIPLARGLSLDLGQWVQITDTLQAQVRAYEFLLDGSQGTLDAKVTLTKPSQQGRSATAPVSVGYAVAFGEIAYKPYWEQMPKHGILNPQNLRAEDLVKAVLYKNLAVTQNLVLQSQTFPSLTAMHALLDQNRTALQVHLQDLVSSDVLEHGIEVEL